MQSSESSTTTITTATATSVDTDTNIDTNQHVIGRIILQQDTFQSNVPSVTNQKPKKTTEDSVSTTDMRELVLQEPSSPNTLVSCRYTRQSAGVSQPSQGSLIVERQQTMQLRQGSLDSACPEISSQIGLHIPPIYQEPSKTCKRTLKISSSWPSENFRAATTPCQHGDQRVQNHFLQAGQKSSNEPVSDTGRFHRPKLPNQQLALTGYEESPAACMEAISPTQEISQILGQTSLDPRQSEGEQFEQTPLMTTLSEINSPEHFPTPSCQEIQGALSAHPQHPSGGRLASSSVHVGGGVTWPGVSSLAQTMTYPYQNVPSGGASAMPYTPCSRHQQLVFPQSSTSGGPSGRDRESHPNLRMPFTVSGTRHRRPIRLPSPGEEVPSSRSHQTMERTSPSSERHTMSRTRRRPIRRGLSQPGYHPNPNMLRVCNAVPAFPFQQSHQPSPFETDFAASCLEESWGPTVLPSIASAFIQRAPSLGELSYTDSMSEHQEMMMDIPSPCPSDAVSTVSSEAQSFVDQMNMEEINDICEVINQDVITTVCQFINISPDPYQWSIEEVDKFIRWTQQEYGLQEINIDYFHMDGFSLCNLSEDDFRRRAPKCGDVIFSYLDMWKSAARPFPVHQLPQECTMQKIPVPNLPSPSYPFNIKIEPEDVDTASIVSSSSSDEQSIPSPTQLGSGPDTSMTPNHTGSIHLWQFLKELLLQPDSYGYCIRWLDRSQGIFKIEDSVKVANLWGRRKNRPAMNYDKMSRSIRQYYKKKIMKKTEVSQRLVYQFVNPC